MEVAATFVEAPSWLVCVGLNFLLLTPAEVSEGETGEASQPKKKAVELENPKEVKYSRSGHSLTSSLQSSASPHQHSPAGGEDEIGLSPVIITVCSPGKTWQSFLSTF